jgi:hypothetical protein
VVIAYEHQCSCFFQKIKTVFLGLQKNQWKNIQAGMHINYARYNFRKKVRYVLGYIKKKKICPK